MASYNHQEPIVCGRLNNQTSSKKESSHTNSYEQVHNPWILSYTGPLTASPFVTKDSPLIATPFLESSVDEALSPACFSPYQTSPFMNHQQQTMTDIAVGQYIDQEDTGVVKKEPVFTGDPMELLIDKSKATTASPSTSSSDGMDTPLFVPIGPFENNDYHRQNQQQQDFNVLDSLCFNRNNSLLFQALEGIVDTAPASRHQFHNEPYNDPYLQQHHHYHPSSSMPQLSQSIENQQPYDEQYSSSSSESKHSKDNHDNLTPIDNSIQGDHTKNNNAKRQRKNSTASTHSTDSESDKRKRRNTRINNNDQKEKRFSCPICRRKFSRRYNLNTHIRTHNVNRIKEFSCDICGTAFDRKHDRDRHLSSVHYGNRSFACSSCEASFCRRDALARHTLKSHSEHILKSHSESI